MERDIDRVCDEFEKTKQDGRPVTIEETHDRGDVRDRDALLYQLIRLESGLRQSAGQPVSPQEFQHRFARKAPLVESAF